MKKISVVIPVYCNEQSLNKLFERLMEVEKDLLENKSILMEVIFVDDGSYDASFEKLVQMKEKRPELIKVIKLSKNFGAIKASKIGVKYATGDCFTIVAADMQEPSDLISQMIDKWLDGNKFVICVRKSREDPLVTRICSSLYHRIIQLTHGRDYPKSGFDTGLMDKSLQKYLVNSSKNIYSPLYMYSLGFKPAIISYDRVKREHGKSKWTFKKKLTAFSDIIIGTSVLPIRFISLVGLIISFLSFSYGVSILISTILGKIQQPGFPSIVALNSFLLGLVIVMLGVIGEYIWRIFDEVNNRPEVVVDLVL